MKQKPRYIVDEITGDPYEMWLHECPTLQRRVYEFLKELTPNHVAFFLQASLPHQFNLQDIDGTTRRLVYELLQEHFEDPKLLITTDDLWVSWLKIKSLYYLFEGVRQNFLIEIPAKDGTVRHAIKEMPFGPPPVKTVFRAKNQNFYRCAYKSR